MKKVVLTSIVALAAELALALELATPFADNMVLQRGCSVPVWGTAEPGEMVTVSFGGQTKSAKADATCADPRPGNKLYPSDHFPVSAI